MTDIAPALLLDTCAMIFIGNASGIDDAADCEIGRAATENRLFVSPMSAWEIGVGVAKGRLMLPQGPLEFFQRFLRLMKVQLCAVSPEILVGSSNLPGRLHGDPMDRILISSARHLDMVLVTRDRPILDYGADGHLRTLAC
jgi:PIN domain nuclease of toxin-antitoxin system